MFGDDPLPVLDAGANGMMVGNYLTTPGSSPERLSAALGASGYLLR